MGRFGVLRGPQDVITMVEETGFLPFFRGDIQGFSVEENCAQELWFSPDADGPWEWKGPVARSGRCAYGKFFGGKAGFVSIDWFADFANARRDGYDFDARFDDGLASIKDRDVFETLTAHGTLLSKELKRLAGYHRGGLKGFDTVITRLQMQTYVVIADFEYMRRPDGEPYGWGVSRYSTPERLFGEAAVTCAYDRPPEESRRRMTEHIKHLLPEADDARIGHIIG